MGLLACFWAQTVHAASGDISLVIQPHCVLEEHNTDWPLGNVPKIEGMINLGSGNCYDYQVEDPQTLKTSVHRKGDTIDIDVVVKNPNGAKIKRVRAWLAYDPTVLRGEDLEVNDKDFPQAAPGEEDFDTKKGYVMIDMTANEKKQPNGKRVLVANVKFEVIDTPDAGTIISFYDIQTDGHTDVWTLDDGDTEGKSALKTDPGSLHVIFRVGSAEACAKDEDCTTGTCVAGVCSTPDGLEDGAACQINSQCASGHCNDGLCGPEEEDDTSTGLSTGTTDLLPNGSPCTNNNECESGKCENGMCVANQPPLQLANGSRCAENSECQSNNCENEICKSKSNLPEGSNCSNDFECASQKCLGGFCINQEEEPKYIIPPTTAFALLQVQNLRVTTKDTSAFLGWDPLNSSQLKAYNIYYGTTPGQYIQRKTIDGNMQSLAIHNLPEGATYYFAIRAVSTTNEESAFSNEVSVTIGSPTSSTAPLVIGPASPVSASLQTSGTVQGDTGIPSPLVLLVFSSAIIGTVFASRRQLAASASKPK
ncbi:MAG: fibronectin type III domain-containing protein [Candidatus Peribacteraceae bacterium]|jgi:hypothetical protein|nr:fibronectin type III domain-containing protein [Candidatus Peribacteraceae bacterium]|tara:strand:+ start:28646 stop:30253 length:1608 start_codon:yes stop_codon:yes gene_type:complete